MPSEVSTAGADHDRGRTFEGLERELSEARQQQTATSEILRIISISPTDTQPVFDAIVASAVRLLRGNASSLTRIEGNQMALAAMTSTDAAGNAAQRARFPLPLDSEEDHAQVTRTRTPLNIADAHADPRLPEAQQASARIRGYRSLVVVPLLRHDEVIGALGVSRREPGGFTDNEIALLQTFADQAVIAIQNTRLFEEVQARTRELQESLEYQTATSEVLAVISRSPTNVQPVFDTIASSAAKLCNALDAIVLRVDRDMLRLVAHHGYMPTDDVPIHRGTLGGRTVIERRLIHVTDLRAEEVEFPEGSAFARRFGHRTTLSIPLLCEGEAIGNIQIRRAEVRPFSAKQIALVQTFADQAVIAIENSRLFEAEQASKSELQESLEYQTTTSEVLNVISRSPTNVRPVFDAIASSAARLCDAHDAVVLRIDGHNLRFVAHYGPMPVIDMMPLDRGTVGGRAVIERRVIHVGDLQAEEREYPLGSANARRAGHRTILSVPLLREGVAIGNVQVRRDEVRLFSDKQIALLETFADQAVIAIENTRLFEEVQARTKELQESLEYQTATSEVLGVISRSKFDLQPVLQSVVETAARLCRADNAILYRLEDGICRFAAGHGHDPSLIDALRTIALPIGPGTAVGRAIGEKGTVQIEDALAEPLYEQRDLCERGNVRSLIGVPLMRDGEPIGAIALARNRVEPFSDREIDVVTTFADQAVIAIENTRLFDEVQARTRDLQESLKYQTATSEVLNVISRSKFDLQPVLDAIVETAARLCVADMAHLRRREGDVYVHVADYGVPPDFRQFIGSTKVEAGRGSIVGRVLSEGKFVQIPDVLTDPEFTLHEMQRRGSFRTILGVPLLREGVQVGIIVLTRRVVQPFTEKQIELVTTFADQAVIAIENARLFEEVRARTSDLTEALEQQTATSDILRVIAGTPDDAQPVFDAIAQSALRLFGVSHVSIMLREGDSVRSKATAGSADPRGDFLIPLERDSTSGRSILDRTAISIGDTEAPDAPTFARDSGRVVGFRAIAAAPMLREGIAIGSVHMMRKTPGQFSNTQIELLKTFADQAVIAIENARLFDEVQLRTRELARSVQELRALGEVGRAVSSTLDLKVVLKTIVDRAVDLSATDAGSLFYYRKEIGTFELGETTGLDEETVTKLRELEIYARQTGPGEAMAKRQPLQIPDLTLRPSDPLRDAVLEAGFRASLIVPLLGAEGPLGTLILRRRRPGEFSATVVSLMQSFADQSAIALENARLFEEIAQKSRELEIASRHKSQFVANMSHELRTPLAAILGYAELMQEGFYGALSEKSTDALTRIRSNGKHLLGLINTVLDIAKIESGQFNLNLGEYAIESVVETVRVATESLAETKKLALKTDVAKKLPVGLGDEQRLTQVLLNLVGNAIKFTDTGEVRITATAMNGHFTVAVTDTGPGIPQDQLKRVFEQFHQIDNSNTKAKGGTGLGLAIAKQIVEMHGGRIWVESTLGQGATFQMELPVRAESRKGAA